MRKINRINWLTGVIIGVVWVGMLTACGGRRAQPESVPANPPQATTAPQKPQPTTVPAPAQPTSAPAAEPPAAISTPTATPAPVATATTAPAAPAPSSESGAALEQVLEQLFNANNSADQLNDVPQLK